MSKLLLARMLTCSRYPGNNSAPSICHVITGVGCPVAVQFQTKVEPASTSASDGASTNSVKRYESSTGWIWLVLLVGWSKFSANQKHYPDLSSYASSAMNFCSRFSHVISRGNHLWRHEMSAVYYGYSNYGNVKECKTNFSQHKWTGWFFYWKKKKISSKINNKSITRLPCLSKILVTSCQKREKK